MSVKPVPEGYHTVTPYLVVKNPDAVIEFLQKAFDAKLTNTVQSPEGVAHAEMQIGDSMIMLGRASAEWQPLVSAIYLYVPDTDAVYKQAIAAGGVSVMEPADQFYGDRNGGVKGPAGNFWWIGTRQENLSAEEIQNRAAQQRG